MMILMGPGGSGKTAVEERLAAIHRVRSPTARLDFALKPDATPAQVMLAIVSELHAHKDRPGKVEFPLLGMAIIALTLDPDDPLPLAEQLNRRLQSRISGKAFADYVAQAAALLPDTVPRAIVGEAAKILGWIFDKVKGSRLEARLRSYAQNVTPGTGLDPLLELYRSWRDSLRDEKDEDGAKARQQAREDVWRGLCAAFLADLRAFSTAGWWSEKATNCLLLLDNADAGIGTELLTTLAECRAKARGESDPLLVVAAQRTRPSLRPPAGQPVDSTGEGLSYPGWLESTRDPEAPGGPWYPVWLTDLTADNVGKAVTTHVLGRSWHDQQFVHEVTGGHPAAVWELADMLDHAEPGTLPRDLVTPEVEGALLNWLRPAEMTNAQLDALAVFAATLRPGPEAAAKVFAALGWQDIDVLATGERFRDLMWASDEDGLAIRPLPRLLLTRWLARDADLWRRVHEGFQACYRGNEARDPAPVWFHELALVASLSGGNLGKVAADLDKRLIAERDGGDAAVVSGAGTGGSRDGGEGEMPAEWDKVLCELTMAPNRLQHAVAGRGPALEAPGLRPEAHDVVKQLVGTSKAGDRLRIISRLVAALWLHNDRLFDPTHTLASLICTEYQQLAQITPGDCKVFYDKAADFRAIACSWGHIS